MAPALIDRVVGRWAADGDVGDRAEDGDGDDSDVTETLGMDTVSCAYGVVTTAGAVDGQAL
jgi:hypothetical protein